MSFPALQGDAEAQNNLGVMYQRGEGVPKNNVKAVKWLRKTAEQGLEETKERLEKLEAK